MNKLSKVLVTIVVLVIWLPLNTLIIESAVPNFFAIMVAAGAIGAMGVIWKKPKKKSDNEDSVLQK